MIRAFAVPVLAMLCSGCVTYQRGVIDAAAPEPLPLDLVSVAEHVEGRSCGKWRSASTSWRSRTPWPRPRGPKR